MLKNSILCVLLLLSSSLALAAEFPAQKQHFGAIELTNLDFKDGLSHSGMLRLTNAKVNQSMIVNGILDAENAQLNDLTANGSVQLTNVNIAGPTSINGQLATKNSNFSDIVTVYGYLNGQTSNFKKLVTIEGVNINFTDCTVQNLMIKGGEPNLVQHLNLKGTKITGDVTFEAGNGIVVADEKSLISGKVNGGAVQH